MLQLCSDGKALLDALQSPVSSDSSNSLTADADYTEGASRILDVVHEVSVKFYLILFSLLFNVWPVCVK